MPETFNLSSDNLKNVSLGENLWQLNKELFSSLDNNWDVNVINDDFQKKTVENNSKKYEELLPWTLYASDLRGDLIKFLKVMGFELVSSNGHEKYKKWDVTVVVPHKHNYFAEWTFNAILKQAGFTKKAYKTRQDNRKK